jgi:hypothetical protein
MSRSGYNDDCDDYRLINLYTGTLARSIRGRRGQALLRDIAVHMDAMTVKTLEHGILVAKDGIGCCALGAAALRRGVDVSDVSDDCPHEVGKALNVTHHLAAEVAEINDLGGKGETGRDRWTRVRKWVADHLSEEP